MNTKLLKRSWLKTIICSAVITGSLSVKLATLAEEVNDSVEPSLPTMPQKLLREGGQIEKTNVVVRATGERLSITLPDGERIVTALENLATQRILKAVIEDPNDNVWLIDGHITEFNDRNFIFLERAQRSSPK